MPVTNNYDRINSSFERAVTRMQESLQYLVDNDKVSNKFVTVQNLIIKSLIDYQQQTESYISMLEMENVELSMDRIKQFEKLRHTIQAFEALCIIHGIMDFPIWMNKGRNCLVNEAIHTSGHFEPQSFVINLTRHSAGSFKYRADLQRRNVEYRHALLSRGLQSFAHEYGHALDYYCGTYVEPNSAKCLTGGMINWNVNVETHYHLAGLMKNLIDKICYDSYGHSTEYINRVKKHSNQKYLLQKNEIFARAFEKYINYKMKNKGWFNVFFTKFKYEEGKDKTVSYGYYLSDNELRAIEKDFDRLLEAISKSLKGVNKLISRSTANYTVKKKGLGNLTDETRTDGVMSIDDAKKANFDLIGLQGKWLNLIGKACKPTHFFIYGIGGSGKSSFVLLFSQYLASLKYKILYVAGEQFGTPTFTELLNRLNIKAGDNFKIVDTLDRLDPHDFDFVVLDSKDNVGVELPTFRELKKQYPEQSFIILSQATKSGNFTGSEKWRNEVDVMLLADNGIIKSGIDKNRWGGAGEMKVF
jgi:uncharacterized protein YbcV (DUF1398 family)